MKLLHVTALIYKGDIMVYSHDRTIKQDGETFTPEPPTAPRYWKALQETCMLRQGDRIIVSVNDSGTVTNYPVELLVLPKVEKVDG